MIKKTFLTVILIAILFGQGGGTALEFDGIDDYR